MSLIGNIFEDLRYQWVKLVGLIFTAQEADPFTGTGKPRLWVKTTDKKAHFTDTDGNDDVVATKSYVDGQIGGEVPKARQIATTAPLTGGGDLSADRTLAINTTAVTSGGAGNAGKVPVLDGAGKLAGRVVEADGAKLDGLPASAPPTGRQIATTAPITGGGDLSADRTLALSTAAVTNGGAGNAGKVPVLDGAGKLAGRVVETDGAKLDGLPASAPPTARQIATTAPITGGGDLSADRTLALSSAMLGADQVVAAAGATPVDVTTRTTSYNGLTAANNITSTMADGSFVSQRHTLRMQSITPTKTVVITPAHFADGVTITLGAKFDVVQLEWQTRGWILVDTAGSPIIA